VEVDQIVFVQVRHVHNFITAVTLKSILHSPTQSNPDSEFSHRP
jgi:hypothetical protein